MKLHLLQSIECHSKQPLRLYTISLIVRGSLLLTFWSTFKHLPSLANIPNHNDTHQLPCFNFSNHYFQFHEHVHMEIASARSSSSNSGYPCTTTIVLLLMYKSLEVTIKILKTLFNISISGLL